MNASTENIVNIFSILVNRQDAPRDYVSILPPNTVFSTQPMNAGTDSSTVEHTFSLYFSSADAFSFFDLTSSVDFQPCPYLGPL